MATKKRKCAYCRGPAQGNYSIHRDGFGVGPEVPLCNAHGSKPKPSCADIWDRIAKPSSNPWAHRPATPPTPKEPG